MKLKDFIGILDENTLVSINKEHPCDFEDLSFGDLNKEIKKIYIDDRTWVYEGVFVVIFDD